jgi:hypothetical protein
MGKYDMGGQFEKGTDLGWYNLTDPKHRTLMRVKVVGASDEEAQ